IVAKLMTDEPRSLVSLRRSVPEHVDAAVLAALEKLPADRTPSARAFADSLENAGASTRATRRRESAATRRVAPSLSIALALLAAGSLSIAAWQWSVTHRGQPKPVTRFAVESPRDVRITIREISGSAVAISPDGNTVAFLATTADGTRRLY